VSPIRRISNLAAATAILPGIAAAILSGAAGAVVLGVGAGEAIASSFRGGIDVSTRSGGDSVTVGERFRVVHEISYPDSLSFIPPDRFESGTCRLVSSTWKEEKKNERVTATARLDFVTTDLEKVRFLAPAGDTLVARGEDVEVAVRRMTGEKSEPKPLKPQWEAPRGYGFLLVIAGALALAALAFWLVRRRRRRPFAKPAEPELPADFLALRRLDEIERMNLVEKGEIKTHYTLVVDALRAYIEKRYGIIALDQTTDEILWDLRRQRVETGDIEPVLREADLVKFAKYRPEVAVAKRLIDTVRGIVARTAYRPLVAVSCEAAGSGEASGSGGVSGSDEASGPGAATGSGGPDRAAQSTGSAGSIDPPAGG
jgi:hypothetical protein